MGATKTTKTAKTWPADDEDGAPKWRLEHSISSKAGCNQAGRKHAGALIGKGELRIGTRCWYDREEKYIRRWRHWGCASNDQIAGLKRLARGDPEDVPGYHGLSSEAQEQVRLALEHGKVVDTKFKGTREDLVRSGFDGEIRDAVSYKVEMTSRGASICRNPTCKAQKIKILKGELRLGIATVFGGQHLSWQYKHGRCISEVDLKGAQELYKETHTLNGIDDLPQEYHAAVDEWLDTGEVVVLPTLAPEPTKKSRKRKAEDEGDAVKEEVDELKTGLKASNKRGADEFDGEAEEPTPKKARQTKHATTTTGEGMKQGVEELKTEPEASKKRGADEIDGEPEKPAPKRTRQAKTATTTADKDPMKQEIEETKTKPKASKKRAANEVDGAEAEEPILKEPRTQPAKNAKTAVNKHAVKKGVGESKTEPKASKHRAADENHGAETKEPISKNPRTQQAQNKEACKASALPVTDPQWEDIPLPAPPTPGKQKAIREAAMAKVKALKKKMRFEARE
ncbi:hypothetical protein CC80DRAFT_226220 [Byssothecium circinans]|uniref:PARP-type domain-containing protein n=1 Tax=Byssothecium circinans TaxID=147558 RepID=A0A6A5TDA3_9PLEO|nr:hypothetical protein CC80DRAFT_226220 [Byssothecium circinans]